MVLLFLALGGAAGTLGGFTTFSTYTYESAALIRDGAWTSAAVYALGSLLVGLLAVGAGIGAATLLLQMRTA